MARLDNTANETTDLLPSPNGRGCSWTNPRVTLSVLGCVGLALEYCHRVNLSVAIVAMVKPINDTSNNDTKPQYDFCSTNNHSSSHEGQTVEGEFAWDSWTQGLVLGAFFWGYASTNLLGGIASEYFGGKVVLAGGILLSSVCSLVSPVSVRASYKVFIVVRVLMGAGQGVSFPALNTLLATWYLPMERSKFTTIVLSGFQIGTVIGMLGTGWLSSTGWGWTSSFYVFGVLGVVWVVLWMGVVTERPEEHPRLRPHHLHKLKEHQHSVKQAERVAIPWGKVFTSLPFWGLLLMCPGNDFGFYTMLTELPTYLHDVQHYDLTSNGFLSALPYLLMWLWSLGWAALMDFLGRRGHISILNVRKLSTAVAIYGPMCGLVICAGLRCAPTVVVVVLCLTGMLNGSVNSGYLCSPQDLAPNLAGTLFGVTNTLGALSGILAPTVTGFILQHSPPQWSWRIVFLLSSCVYLVSASFYLIVATEKVQPWNQPDCGVKVKDSDFKNSKSHKRDNNSNSSLYYDNSSLQ
ncbi:hypothetical protein Pcinc_040040 [Petrolisthes cinctipes]|uniref:Major facilitator superfamily (MFS) profile domain-containing protein n=1 Tax=Petrolisthes cinctipes TaxID=88211 RepID=A0AAE1BMP0_PETCI|nr:hypothetical protein Pcinc_040040 [Petrolisthes cinctipes]